MINMTAILDELDLAGAGPRVPGDGPVLDRRSCRRTARAVLPFRRADRRLDRRGRPGRGGRVPRVLRPRLPDPRCDPPRHPGRDGVARRPAPVGEHRAGTARRSAHDPAGRAEPVRVNARAATGVGPHTGPGRRVRRARERRPCLPGRCVVRVLASRVPPVRAMARPRRRAGAPRRARPPARRAWRRAALLGARGADRRAERESARGGAGRRRAHRGTGRDRRRRAEDGAARAPRPTTGGRGRRRPRGHAAFQRRAGARPRRHEPAAALPKLPARRLERAAELRRPARRAHRGVGAGRGGPRPRSAPALCVHDLRDRRHARAPRSPHRLSRLPRRAGPGRQGLGGVPRRPVEHALDVVEGRAPGFRDSVTGVAAWTPDRMESQERWPGGHPMHLDITLDQLGPLRPTRALGRWRTPVAGLYVSGAGTNPSGGILGTPGRAAARAVLRDDP
jgi:hypothetical protein